MCIVFCLDMPREGDWALKPITYLPASGSQNLRSPGRGLGRRGRGGGERVGRRGRSGRLRT